MSSSSSTPVVNLPTNQLQSTTLQSSLTHFEVDPSHLFVGHCTLTVAEKPRTSSDEKGPAKRAAGSKRQGGSKRAMITGLLQTQGVQAAFYFYFKLIGKKTFSNSSHVSKYTRCNFVKHVQQFNDFSLITIFTSPGVEKNSREIGVRLNTVKDVEKHSHPPLVLSTGHDVAKVHLRFYIQRHHNHNQSGKVYHPNKVELHSIYSEMSEIVFGIDAPSAQVHNGLKTQSSHSIREDLITTAETNLRIVGPAQSAGQTKAQIKAQPQLETVVEEDEKLSDLQLDDHVPNTVLSTVSSMSSSSSSSVYCLSNVSSPVTTPFHATAAAPSTQTDDMTDDHMYSQDQSLYPSEQTPFLHDNMTFHTLPGNSAESYDQLPLNEVISKSSPVNEDNDVPVEVHQHRKRKSSSDEVDEEYHDEYNHPGRFQSSNNKRCKTSSSMSNSPSPLPITIFGTVEGVFQHPHSGSLSSPSRDYEEEDTTTDTDNNEEEEPHEPSTYIPSTRTVESPSRALSSWYNSPSLTITVPEFPPSNNHSTAYDDNLPSFTMSPLILGNPEA